MCSGIFTKFVVRFLRPPHSPLFETYNNSFSREYFTAALGSELKALNLGGNYSAHSFRQGAATSARLAGLNQEEIQLLGGGNRIHGTYMSRFTNPVLSTLLAAFNAHPPPLNHTPTSSKSPFYSLYSLEFRYQS